MKIRKNKMPFKDQLEKYRKTINIELEKFFDAKINNAEDPFIKYCYSEIKSFALSGGKRIRPFILNMSYFACNGNPEKSIMHIGMGIELLHTGSLILDDIMDEDNYRRGKPSMHKRMKDYFTNNFNGKGYRGHLFKSKSSRFGASFALMLGNLANIFARSLVLESRFKPELKLNALRMIEKTDIEIYQGQMLDLAFENSEFIKEKQYLKMISLKTCSLISLCFGLGAMLSGADENTVNLLRQFGALSAYSFQIMDDIIDITGKKGHSKGSDIIKNKKTLLMIKALELSDSDQKKRINALLKEKSPSEKMINEIISIMRSTGSISYCNALAKKMNSKAKSLLSEIKIPRAYKKLFLEYLDYLGERKN